MRNDRPLLLALFAVALGLAVNGIARQAWPATADSWVAIFTFFLFVSTTGLGLSTYFLWRTTHQSILDARSNNERALRAYVCMAHARLDGFQVGRTPTATITLENSGQTPAYELRGARHMAVQELDSAWPPPVDLTDNARWPRTPLGPGSKYVPSVSLRRPLSDDDVRAITREQRALVIWGVAYYRDAFDHERETRYCLLYTGPVSAQAVEMSIFSMGNTAT